MTTTERTVDVVVLGQGPGGEHAAIKLGRAGLSVVAVEDRLVGGECPYYGCVPSKMMLAAAQALPRAGGTPVAGDAGPDQEGWARVAGRIREEATHDWDDTEAVERLRKSGVRFVRGRGTVQGPGRVRVGDTTYTAARGLLLNTGTSPAVPPIEGLAETPYWTNREVMAVTELPASLVVIGGGAVGCELAQVFGLFGVRVSLVETADRLLIADEPEASEELRRVLAADGIRVLTGADIRSVGYADGRFTVRMGEQELSAEKVLVAAGRRPNLAGIGLEAVGLDPDAAQIDTDDRMRAGERLWAVGDITGRGPYTHVSLRQSDVAIRDILGESGPAADYRAVTRVTYTRPEVAAVGLTEAEAREQGLAVRTATTDLGARGWIAGERGLIKLVADADRGLLVGATVVAAVGGEVLSMLATAVHARVPLTSLRGMHFAYPTYHRAVETALGGLV